MPLGVSFPQLVLVPPLVLLASALALFTFQNVYRVLFTNLKPYKSIPIVNTLMPYIMNMRQALEQVLGKAASIKFNLSHVLAMGIIIMLLAVLNAIQRNNELQEQRMRAELLRKQKNKHE